MYSQQDLDDAVAAGAIPQGAADALRAYTARARSTPTVDQEHFRLVLGFNDIFVSIAAVILMVAVTWIAQSAGAAMGLQIDNDGPSPLAGLALGATAWGLATYFTGKKRMALPSIVLLGGFVGGVFTFVGSSLVMAMIASGMENPGEWLVGLVGALSFAATALAARAHWNRFRVPITVAAGAVAVAGIGAALVGAGLAEAGLEGTALEKAILAIVLGLGVLMFTFAMRWDARDPERITRASDVAFWLHLAAAVMIVHPTFSLLGIQDGSITMGEGLVAVGLYVALGLVALAVDRRAMLVSALAYVLWALNALFAEFGAVELNIALAALVIGSGLLLLSATWHQARLWVVDKLPAGVVAKLPSTKPAGAIEGEVSPEPVG